MSDVIKVENLRLRRQDLAISMAEENGQADIKTREAEQHRLNAAEYAIRLDEVDFLMKGTGYKHESKNVIPMHQPASRAVQTKPSLRYRNPGATTDIVTLAYDAPGIEVDVVTTTVYEKYKQQGTTKNTVSKMVRRMIREGYAYREGRKLYLTEICRSTWEASPLYQAS